MRAAPGDRSLLPTGRAALAAVALWLLACGTAAAQGPPLDPFFASVRAAFAAGRTEKSAVRGIHNAQRAFAETRHGAVLVGLECGVGKFFNNETIYAVRAIYRTGPAGEYGSDHGLFADKYLGPKKTVKTRVLRTLIVQAPAGYAVGGITLRTGLNIDGLSLTYMKISGQALDPNQALVSQWVGNRTGGGESSVGCGGAPIVGIYGSQDETHVHALGLICVSVPPQATPPPAAPPPPPPPPPENPPPVNPPPEAVAPPPVEQAPPPPAPGFHPPRPSGQAPAPAAAPPAAPAPEPPAKAAPEAAAELVDRAAVKAAKTGRAATWLPVMIFGMVAAVVLAVSLAFVGAKKRATRRSPRKPQRTARAGAELVDPEPAADPVPQTGIAVGAPKASAPLAPIRVEDLPMVTLAPTPEPVSRGENVVCGRCARAVAAKPGMPSWCPHCGGELKHTPTDPHAITLDKPGHAVRPALDVPKTGKAKPPKLLQPSYFVGRSDSTYRVYVLPRQLLFLVAPARDDRSGTERLSTLDDADTQDLLDMAVREADSFAVAVDDLDAVRIEAGSFWQRLAIDPAAAQLQFHHPEHGEVAIDLPRPDDMRVAIQQLKAVLGEKLTVNAG